MPGMDEFAQNVAVRSFPSAKREFSMKTPFPLPPKTTPAAKALLHGLIAVAVSIACASQSTASTKLFGSVNHSEVLPPLDYMHRGSVDQSYSYRNPNTYQPKRQYVARIRQGAIDEGVMPQGQPREKNILWIPIPKWLAGTWSKQGDLTVSSTDMRSGVSSPVNQWTPNFQTTTWGNQIDGCGNIWHGYSIPTEIDGNSSGKTVKFVIIDGHWEPSSPDHLITRVRSIVISSYGRQVVDEFQQEALNDLCLLQTGELANYGSTRDFTNQGLPLRQGMLISRFTKVRSFEPVEFQDGVDLVKSLNEYLKTHNMCQFVRKTADEHSTAPH